MFHTAAVLLHGLCSSHDELLGVTAALRHAGHEPQLLKIAGYSYDPGAASQRAQPFESWLADIAAALAALRQTHERVVLIGLSSGATLALAATLRQPALVDGLVLMSLPLFTDGWATPRHRFLLPLALYTPLGRLWRYRERPPYGVKDERVRQWVARQLRERRLSAAGAAVLEVGHLRENHRLTRHVKRHIGQAVCSPVLALHALEDEVASPANLDWLQRRLHCASLRRVLLEDCYHMISIDTQRQRVARETVEFVNAIAARPVDAKGARAA